MRLPIAGVALLVFGAPSLAAAQQPQPWTESDDVGARVVGAFPVEEGESDFPYRLRGALAGGWSSSIKGGDYTQTPISPYGTSGVGLTMGGSEAIFAANLARVEGLEGFLSIVSYAASFSNAGSFSSQTANPNPLASPAIQWGDSALGARYRRTLAGEAMAWGVEGGAMVLGTTRPSSGSSASSGFLAGPNTSAIGYFGRGLFSWRNTGGLTLTGNLGLYQDNSWQVWKSAANDQSLSRDISGEERIAMGVSGDGGTVLRPIGGVQVVREKGALRPFAELSFEVTSGELGWRLTPGVSWRSGNLSVLGYLDLAPTGSSLTKAPEEPFLRAGVGLAYAFGNPIPHTARPPSRKSGYQVKVEDQEHSPVVGARVYVYDTPAGDRKSTPFPTNRDGVASIPHRELPNARFAYAKRDFYEQWPAPPTHSTPLDASGNGQLLMLVQGKTVSKVRLDLMDEHGKPLRPMQVRLDFASAVPSSPFKPNSFFVSIPGPAVERLIPVGDWGVLVSVQQPGGGGWTTLGPGASGLDVSITPTTTTLPIYFDLAASLALKAPLAEPVVLKTWTLAGLFDPDLADVKPSKALTQAVEELRAFLRTPEGQGKHVFVTLRMKAGGDPLFLKTVGTARGEAVTQYLKGHGVEGSSIGPAGAPTTGDSEQVLLEVK